MRQKRQEIQRDKQVADRLTPSKRKTAMESKEVCRCNHREGPREMAPQPGLVQITLEQKWSELLRDPAVRWMVNSHLLRGDLPTILVPIHLFFLQRTLSKG